MKYVIIDPVEVATKLANEKVLHDLVDPHGHAAVLRKEDLYKSNGEYKTWVMCIFIEEYEFFFKLLTDEHNEKLLKK